MMCMVSYETDSFLMQHARSQNIYRYILITGGTGKTCTLNDKTPKNVFLGCFGSSWLAFSCSTQKKTGKGPTNLRDHRLYDYKILNTSFFSKTRETRTDLKKTSISYFATNASKQFLPSTTATTLYLIENPAPSNRGNTGI